VLAAFLAMALRLAGDRLSFRRRAISTAAWFFAMQGILIETFCERKHYFLDTDSVLALVSAHGHQAATFVSGKVGINKS
jgi:hypothetical protein